MSIVVSLADQTFDTAASLGIYTVSKGLLGAISRHPAIGQTRTLVSHGMARDLPPNECVRMAIRDGMSRGLPRVWWDQVGVYRCLSKRDDDWLFLPKGFASFVKSCPIRLAAYVHDIIAVTYADRYPGSYSRIKQAYFRACYRATAKQACVVFTNTEFTKCEFEHWVVNQSLKCPPVVTVGYGVEALAASNPDLPKDNRVLVFTRKAPHKRTDLAFQYVERWRKESRFEGSLFALGSLPDDLPIPINGKWTHADRVPPDRYSDLVAQSRVVVHFSECEGFGMPPVEAVLAGTCPVYSDLPPEREAMLGAGFPFDNASYESFAVAMNQAMKTPRAQVESWADQLTVRHDWRVVADRIVSTLCSFS